MANRNQYGWIDRQSGMHPDLCRWSYANPRYYVTNRDTNAIVDECTTQREAKEMASMFSKGIFVETPSSLWGDPPEDYDDMADPNA